MMRGGKKLRGYHVTSGETEAPQPSTALYCFITMQTSYKGKRSIACKGHGATLEETQLENRIQREFY